MSTPKSVFVDFIPEGQEEGSPYGKGGFQDFVPAPEPRPLAELPQEEVKKEEVMTEPKVEVKTEEFEDKPRKGDKK